MNNLEPNQTSKMKLIAKIVSNFYPLIISVNSSIFDVYLGSECTFLFYKEEH